MAKGLIIMLLLMPVILFGSTTFEDKSLEEIESAIKAQTEYVSVRQNIINQINKNYIKQQRGLRPGSADWNRYWKADKEGKIALSKLRILEELKLKKIQQLKPNHNKNKFQSEETPRGQSVKAPAAQPLKASIGPGFNVGNRNPLDAEVRTDQSDKTYIKYPPFDYAPKNPPKGAMNFADLYITKKLFKENLPLVGRPNKFWPNQELIELAFHNGTANLYTGLAYQVKEQKHRGRKIGGDYIHLIGFYKEGKRTGWWKTYEPSFQKEYGGPVVVQYKSKEEEESEQTFFLQSAGYYKDGYEYYPSIINKLLARNAGSNLHHRPAIQYYKNGKAYKKSYINSQGLHSYITYKRDGKKDLLEVGVWRIYPTAHSYIKTGWTDKGVPIEKTRGTNKGVPLEFLKQNKD